MLVVGTDGGASEQLREQLEATGCTVERCGLATPLETVVASPDLVAIVAPSREDIARVMREAVGRFPGARILGFVDVPSGSNGAAKQAVHGRVIDLPALVARPLATAVQLVLDGEALAARLTTLTAEMDALLKARENAHAALEDVAQSIRSAASGLLAALKMLQWGTTDVERIQPALLDSMRVSLESLLHLAEGLPTHGAEEAPVLTGPERILVRR